MALAAANTLGHFGRHSDCGYSLGARCCGLRAAHQASLAVSAADSLACSLFGIPNDIAMQVVGVGFIIGVIQDSCETALNSASDVMFTAASEFRNMAKAG